MNIFTSVARQSLAGLVVLLGLTLLLGGAYPAAVWAVSRVTAHSADGAPLRDDAGCVVGSARLGHDVHVADGQPDPYLHSRPTGMEVGAVIPEGSSGPGPTNLGPSSSDLAVVIGQRRALIGAREGISPDSVPPDAVTASGSGLDPHISRAYADLQIPRIARTTGRSEAEVRGIVDAHTSRRNLGVLGNPTVAVAPVNVALGHTAPNCSTR